MLCDVLKLDTNIAIAWFEHDYMENQSKFQGIILGEDVSQSVALADQGHDSTVFNHRNVLGATLDHKLIFDMHAGIVCLFASR